MQARDVSVATKEPHGLSVQNVLPAVVEAIGPASPEQEVVLTLRVGTTALLARVTRDAVARLGLAPRRSVWALVKSVAFDGGGR